MVETQILAPCSGPPTFGSRMGRFEKGFRCLVAMSGRHEARLITRQLTGHRLVLDAIDKAYRPTACRGTLLSLK